MSCHTSQFYRDCTAVVLVLNIVSHCPNNVFWDDQFFVPESNFNNLSFMLTFCLILFYLTCLIEKQYYFDK